MRAASQLSNSVKSKRENFRNQIRHEQLQQIFKRKRLETMREGQQDERYQLQDRIQKCQSPELKQKFNKSLEQSQIKIKKNNELRKGQSQNISNPKSQLQLKHQKLKKQIKDKKQKLLLVQNLAETSHIQRQKVKSEINNNNFEISIIKLRSNPLYIYGAEFSQFSISEMNYFNKKDNKFGNTMKNINILDLKLFIIATLYPTSDSIFSNFSLKSDVYKIMFGLNTLSKQKSEECMIMLKRTIKQHSHKKKYLSLQECIKSSIIERKKKLIFITSYERFKNTMSEVINQIQSFSSCLLKVSEVQYCQLSNSYENTIFSHHQLTIYYIYHQIKVKTVFDMLFCVPFQVSKKEIESLRRKTKTSQPVLCWFQIPKDELQEQRIKILMQIDSILNQTNTFSLIAKKQISISK